LHQENDMCGVASMIASKVETESVAYKADEPSISTCACRLCATIFLPLMYLKEITSHACCCSVS